MPRVPRGEQVTAVADELVLVEQRERSRLAADLHDYLAQLLTACHLKLTAAIPRQSDEAALLNEVDNLVRECLAYTRSLVTQLSPAVLHEGGLVAAIRWLAGQMSSHGLHVEVRTDAEELSLPEQHAVFLFRSVRELLFNVLKHAGVAAATVSIRCSATRLSVEVEDRGRGCDPQRSAPRSSATFGLRSIRERLAALGGGLEITSAPHAGTRATIWIPRTGMRAGETP